ncbi:phosphoribosylglycinamide formyltransferase [Paramaledivibacter caminithermalis]|jgi:phosphoribosylglycinamide formyltransferase-1|uniref:Phosphoribosylglycinamide formyltransferase n=1 Tax=Paramaledivibacter caminithermalis (strain DSM 15212 / CIP 107654 / DViRD3) TaxID=1121301 RepID=A0A1M6QIW7_PARC5|nr:phosphoribosylglycinamide formyltransferase [Paramaledivibacter caminithermalis]SHK20254.1 formyltetrahydrofolate-dependent phosphoribosylglycinamide formyltransferase [Paramaledivibacter caminithermalis DSM 15212]
MSVKKIAVLVSGRGSNLQTIIDNIENGSINGKIEVVISSKRNAYALKRAANHDIEGIYIGKENYPDVDSRNDKLIEVLKKREIDLIVLAGYMSILNKRFVEIFKNKIINIHPSLIPSFCGKGYYGSRVHKAVLDYGVKLTGATVHFVDEGTDTGPVILQKTVEVDFNDTVETLSKKVLKIEHELLPLGVKLFCEDRLHVEGRKVKISMS